MVAYFLENKTLKFSALLTMLFFYNLAFGQKYMIVGKDTLPFKAKMVVSSDTIHKGNSIYVKLDTLYEDPCQVFEKIKGKTINRTDSSCLKQGLWIDTDSTGNYSTSVYVDGNDEGKWKNYDKNGKLLKESEEVSLGNHFYIVKQIDYSSGKPVTIINVPFFGFYINHFSIIVPILVILLLLRAIINNNIYNIENQTSYSAFGSRFKSELGEPDELRHRVLCMFTLWFFRYKPESRNLVLISNLLSILCFGSIAIFAIGPVLCG
jgi:hypothetical protein